MERTLRSAAGRHWKVIGIGWGAGGYGPRTTKGQPRGAARREPRSGTETANPRWLERFVGPSRHGYLLTPSKCGCLSMRA